MKLNDNQNRILDLTFQLESRTLEYRKLCDELEKIKQEKINPNDQSLLALKEKFEKNLNEITKITNELEALNKK